MIQAHEQLTFWLDGSTSVVLGRPAAALAEEALRIDMDRLLQLDAFRWLASFSGEQDASI